MVQATDQSTPSPEREGRKLAERLITHVTKQDGQYLRDHEGELSIVVSGRRIPLNGNRDNYAFAKLMLNACGVSTLSTAAQIAVQRVQVHAAEIANRLRLRRFSALSDGGGALYVPRDTGRLLLVTADGIETAANGDNDDHLWVEHPCADPVSFTDTAVDALQDFERLLVDTQACTVPAMRWFVAMHAGLFPYIRDLCPSRFILEPIGPSQCGKTTGAARFTCLHGLGDVKGDVTVATLGNIGDIGLLVLDNKEQANFTQDLIDFCLYLATGAERQRSHSDGRLRAKQEGRPVAIITTIEGVVKAEVQNRCVEVQYSCTSGPKLLRGAIEGEIRQRRHDIRSALLLVITHYLQLREEQRPTPNPLPNFPEHFTALCDLLRAYGDVAGKPEQWSEDILAEWDAAIKGKEIDEDDLEHPLLRVFERHNKNMINGTTYAGQSGKLFVTEAAPLLTMLQNLKIRDLAIPKNPNGLTRRLGSCNFRAFTFLKTDTPNVSALSRTAKKRPIGFFIAD